MYLNQYTDLKSRLLVCPNDAETRVKFILQLDTIRKVAQCCIKGKIAIGDPNVTLLISASVHNLAYPLPAHVPLTTKFITLQIKDSI
jgi:hypothetical protein